MPAFQKLSQSCTFNHDFVHIATNGLIQQLSRTKPSFFSSNSIKNPRKSVNVLSPKLIEACEYTPSPTANKKFMCRIWSPSRGNKGPSLYSSAKKYWKNPFMVIAYVNMNSTSLTNFVDNRVSFTSRCFLWSHLKGQRQRKQVSRIKIWKYWFPTKMPGLIYCNVKSLSRIFFKSPIIV